MLTPEQQEEVDGFLRKYKEPLSIEQLAEGIAACIENASCLFEDAQILIESRRFGRAMSLLIAAMEELGKVSVLAGMSRIPKSNQALWADLWADFRSHEAKGTYAFVNTYPDEARADPDLIQTAAILQYELAPLGERIRQRGVYVDFHGDEKRWLSPQEVTSGDVHAWVQRVATAQNRIQCFQKLGLFSVAALRLQKEVYGPINSKKPKRARLQVRDVEAIKTKALCAHREYFQRLIEQGILPRGTDVTVLGIAVDALRDGTDAGECSGSPCPT
jgi:AbiV family abortive infection protein